MTEIEVEEMIARRPSPYVGMPVCCETCGWGVVERIDAWISLNLLSGRVCELKDWYGPKASAWSLPGETLEDGSISVLPDHMQVQEWRKGDMVLQRSSFFGTWHLERIVLGHKENGNASCTAMRPPRGYVMTRPPAELSRVRASQAIAARPASEQAGLAAAGAAALGEPEQACNIIGARGFAVGDTIRIVDSSGRAREASLVDLFVPGEPRSAIANRTDLRAPCKADRVRVRRFETPWDGEQ